MIAVSFPCAPWRYPHDQHYSHAQISSHVFNALQAHFEDVTFFLQEPGTTIPLAGNDILVANLSHHTADWKRTVLVDADNFENDKWLHGRFRKYGMDHPTDEVFHLNSHIEGRLAAVLMSNDVALRKWHADDPSVAQKKAFWLGAVPSVTVMPHPIDKAYFGQYYKPEKRFDRVRMLIADGGERKNAKQLIAMLERLGYVRGEHFEAPEGINRTKTAVPHMHDQIMIFAHTSISECFPYLANEFMAGGMMLFGHEEWWDGYGSPLLTWTYDPSRQGDNEARLNYLFDPRSLDWLHWLREDQHAKHMNRTDNNWSCLTDAVVREVAKHR